MGNFVIYADRCDPSFLALLESEDDVSVLVSDTLKFGDTFGKILEAYPRRLGTLLGENFSTVFSRGRWHLVVDADEFLVLPPLFTVIQDYIALLEDRGRGFAFAPMVDFYPRRLSERNFGYGTDPFAGAPFFDRGPYHVVKPEVNKVTILAKGVRWRLLRTLWRYRRQVVVDAGLNLDKMKYIRTDAKHPLLKASDGLRRVGSHEISTATDTSLGCVLCHFKFYPQLDEKIAVALGERQYNAGSREYMLMSLMIEHIGDADLVSEVSMRYSGPEDLVAGDLLSRLP